MDFKRLYPRHVAGTIYKVMETGELMDSHCLACAKIEVVTRGNNVDLRGWHLQGDCGEKLRRVVMTVRGEVIRALRD